MPVACGHTGHTGHAYYISIFGHGLSWRLCGAAGPGVPGHARARASAGAAPPHVATPPRPARDRASPRPVTREPCELSARTYGCVCVGVRTLFCDTHRLRHALYTYRMFLSASSSSRTWRLDFAKAARPVHLHHELLDERLSLRAFVAQLVPLLDERREHLGSRRREPAQHGRQVA